MDGVVGAALPQREFEFFDEDVVTAERVERAFLVAVGAGRYGQDRRGDPRGRQLRDRGPGLTQGERARARRADGVRERLERRAGAVMECDQMLDFVLDHFRVQRGEFVDLAGSQGRHHARAQVRGHHTHHVGPCIRERLRSARVTLVKVRAQFVT